MARRGFSLIEILFSLGLVSLIAVTLLGVILSAISATKEAGHRASAAHLAQSTIETLAQSSPPVGPQPVAVEVLNGMEFLLEPSIELATPDVPVLTTDNSRSNPATISNLDPQQARMITVVVRWGQQGRQPRSHTVRRQVFVRP